MDRVDDRLKQRKALRRQADASANYNAGIVCGSQVALHRPPGRLIRTDEAEISRPPIPGLSSAAQALPRSTRTAPVSQVNILL